jgi:hypothetical protein
LRFSRDVAAQLDACPRCTQPLVRTARASDALGYPLFEIGDPRPTIPAAASIALGIPSVPRERS